MMNDVTAMNHRQQQRDRSRSMRAKQQQKVTSRLPSAVKAKGQTNRSMGCKVTQTDSSLTETETANLVARQTLKTAAVSAQDGEKIRNRCTRSRRKRIRCRAMKVNCISVDLVSVFRVMIVYCCCLSSFRCIISINLCLRRLL